MQGEFDYFAARSGLEEGSLVDHMFAFYTLKNGGGGKRDLSWQMLKYFQTQNADLTPDLGYQMLTYYRAQSGLENVDIGAAMAAFFADPPPEIPPAWRIGGIQLTGELAA